jgi:Tol biopolymer transport system component
MEHPLRYDDRGVVGVVDRHGNHRVLTREYWGLQGLAWSRTGDRILFAGAVDAGFYQLHSVDFSGHDRLILPSAGTLTMHDVASSGRWLIAREDWITRLFVKPPGGGAELDYSWLDHTGGAQLSGDGTLIAFDDASRDAGPSLGPGYPSMISSDKRWVLSIVVTVPPQLVLYPVGPGETRRLDHGELESYTDARFFPGDSTLLICGNEPGHAVRCYVRPLAGGTLHPITPEGTTPGVTISPDGRTVLARTAAGYGLYPVDGGAPRAVPALSPEEDVVGWSPNGRAVWVTREGRVPLNVEQLDLASGRLTPMMTIEPASRAGIVELGGLSLADDPRVYAYSSVEQVSRIFVVTGMQ